MEAEKLDKFEKAISGFCCSKDSDVENYLKTKAVTHEKKSKSRTYLIVDIDKLEKEKEISILAYFTIANKTLFIDDTVSKEKIKKLDGLSKNKTELPAYLIGQLGKNDKYKDFISGEDVINYAMDVINQVHELLGGRFVLIECNNNQKLIDFYKRNEFIWLQQDGSDGLIQMIRFL